ncbi:hypothetical protein PSN45_004236 [Yamadazyma tenuis]|uniref:Uncharacterized protein n=1 Tax=Candida tenuis (strain ATCC 10573 / BCRC 21748 / CBS 615 / JCM 9827 / NBRC 10315 / NRRL Y-1498 / VKM Y-70) TaxID=590646 RepID=G3B6J3_CANTC|nr:uncharacterized protein CANTEDRAFT_135288 [Yamadazyma tenuis ATCC 10573]EGV63483.1 hypothetical protein CANTEDRAFT_135288 [Yamadazyma tenuis ATCC 10573]WEJ96693.1 hypothetical protein PSN45_004236 [Yamadazyma tenuis]
MEYKSPLEIDFDTASLDFKVEIAHFNFSETTQTPKKKISLLEKFRLLKEEYKQEKAKRPQKLDYDQKVRLSRARSIESWRNTIKAPTGKTNGSFSRMRSASFTFSRLHRSPISTTSQEDNTASFLSSGYTPDTPVSSFDSLEVSSSSRAGSPKSKVCQTLKPILKNKNMNFDQELEKVKKSDLINFDEFLRVFEEREISRLREHNLRSQCLQLPNYDY